MVSAWSFGTSRRPSLNANGKLAPGPGAYQFDKQQKIFPPKWRFGTSNRQNLVRNQIPGPGTYDSKSLLFRYSQKYSFAQKYRNRQFLLAPGPGTYNPSILFSYNSIPKYTFGMKTASSQFYSQKNTPGPGQYQHKSTVVNQPSMKFPLSQRQDLSQTEKIPGVGTYSAGFFRPESAGPKYGFAKSARDGFSQSKLPGPGQYNMKSMFDQSFKGITMISRRPESSQVYSARIPGPGTYNPTLKHKRSVPCYGFGSGNRPNVNSQLSVKVPGPGQYDPYNQLLMPYPPKFRMGTDTRKPLSASQVTPGPGTYQLYQRVIEGPKYTMRCSMQTDPSVRESSYKPGPGQYQPKMDLLKERPSSAKIGSSLRPMLSQTIKNPGPGQYNLRQKLQGPFYGFGTQNRNKLTNSQDPGPGNYDLKPFFGDVPKYLQTGNWSQRKA